jgi:hypothetical protein
MSLNQSLYFMSLVGGMSGLFSWALTSTILSFIEISQNRWTSDLIAAVLLGGLLGGMTVGFSDHWAGNRVTTRWVISGTLIGIVAGLLAGTMQVPISSSLGDENPLLSRVISWTLAGAFIGLGLGLRWVHVNRARAAHAFLGGFVGGAVGGLLFAGFGSRIPDLSQAMSFVLTGVGISLGITLAPILLRDAVLEFVSSGDARAQGKFGKTRKQWELQDGDTYILGSQSQDGMQTRYRPVVEIFIPDASIAAQHAKLYAKEGHFYIARHPDVGGQAGLARYVLRVRGKTVTTSAELRDSDDILIGRTALVFSARAKGRSA